MDALPLRIKLLGAHDDPPVNSPEFQEGMQPVGTSFRSAGVEYRQRAMAFDSVEVLGYPLPEYTIPLAQIAIPAICGAVGIWLQGRAGRKARIKIGDMEVEARTPQEVERLLDKAMQMKSEQGSTDKG